MVGRRPESNTFRLGVNLIKARIGELQAILASPTRKPSTLVGPWGSHPTVAHSGNRGPLREELAHLLTQVEELEAEDQLRRDTAIVEAESTKHKGTAKSNGSKSQRCAATVAKIHSELHTILRSIEAGEEDFSTLRKENPRYLTFKAVKQSPQLREKIVHLAMRRGRMLGLAQDLAGVLHGRRRSTVEGDWKRFKPASYRRSE